MGDVVRFPVEKIDGYFDETRFRPEPAAILLLPVVRVDRDDPVAEPPARRLRRRRRSDPPSGGLLSPGTEERVRAAFERLRAGDVSMANLPEYDPGPANVIGPLEIGTWPWPGDTGDETGA